VDTGDGDSQSLSYTILAPAFYNDWNKVRYLKQSAERWHVPITFYGFGEPYKGWFDVQVTRLLQEIEKAPTTHVIYTDASDALINGPIPRLDSEICYSVEQDIKMCAGGWLGPKNLALQILTLVRDCELDHPDFMNPQERWRAILPKTGHYTWPDYHRSFFQVADEPLEIQDKRLYNPRTQTFPFIVHWAGGYTDPKVGKAALIEPYWSQLGF
jgi:hypothetical protein